MLPETSWHQDREGYPVQTSSSHTIFEKGVTCVFVIPGGSPTRQKEREACRSDPSGVFTYEPRSPLHVALAKAHRVAHPPPLQNDADQDDLGLLILILCKCSIRLAPPPTINPAPDLELGIV